MLNAEGLWARHADAEAALAEVGAAAARRPGRGGRACCRSCTPRRSTLDLLTEAIKRMREAGVTVAARVSPQRARELAPDLLAAGVEMLVVQGTIVSAEHVSRGAAAEPQDFIADLDVPVIVGGCRRLPDRACT